MCGFIYREIKKVPKTKEEALQILDEAKNYIYILISGYNNYTKDSEVNTELVRGIENNIAELLSHLRRYLLKLK